MANLPIAQATGTGALKVRLAINTNTALSGVLINGAVVQGVPLATNDRVLLTAQTNQAENRIWVVPASGALLAPADFATAFDAAITTVRATDGAYAGQQFNQKNSPAVVGTNGLTWTLIGAGLIGGSAMYYLDPQLQTNGPTTTAVLSGTTLEHIWWNVAAKTDPTGNITFNPTTGTFALKQGRYVVSSTVNARYSPTSVYQAGIYNHTTGQFEASELHSSQPLGADQITAGHRRVKSYAIVDVPPLGAEISAAFTGGFGSWPSYFDATAFGLSNAQMARWNSIEIHQISGPIASTGQKVSFVYAKPAATANLAINDAIPYTVVTNGNIPHLGGGRYRLEAESTYELEAAASVGVNINDTSYRYQWYNVTAGAFVGTYNGGGDPTGVSGFACPAIACITPSVTTDVEVRVISDDASTLTPEASYLKIIQLGSSATTETLPSQGGQAGKVLGTDGNVASWVTGAPSARLSLPAVGAIAKGRPVEWFNNGGIPSVRDCLQGTPGLSAPYDIAGSAGVGNDVPCFVGGNFNAGVYTKADNGNLSVVRLDFNTNGAQAGSASSSATVPANIVLMNGACNQGVSGNLSYAAWALSDNGSQNYMIAANMQTVTPTVGSISGGYGGQRSCVCPSSLSGGGGFWFLVSSGSSHNIYHNTINAAGSISAQNSGGLLSIDTMSGSGQTTQMYILPSTPGTRDGLWVFLQTASGALVIANWGINLPSASGIGVGGIRSLANVNSGVAAMQCIPARGNGGTMNIAYISNGGQLIMAYVDGNASGPVSNISGAYTPPNFPVGYNPLYVQICPKNYNPQNLQSQSVSAGAPIGGGGTSRYVLSYTAPNTTVTHYCDVSFNWADLTFTTNFTQSIGHTESANGVESARPSNLIGSLTDPACFFFHRVAGSGGDRFRNVVAGSTSVSSNVFAISDGTVANGVACPLAFEGDTITGLTGLTPGAKHFMSTVNGSVVTSNTGVPLLHALDASRAVVKINP